MPDPSQTNSHTPIAAAAAAAAYASSSSHPTGGLANQPIGPIPVRGLIDLHAPQFLGQRMMPIFVAYRYERANFLLHSKSSARSAFFKQVVCLPVINAKGL